jgi:two-component system, OmpR family, sensor kinase
VALSARADGAFVEIEVRDRGIGIDAADLPRLFTPFFRTDRSRARGTGGVGLGLALVKRIAEAHGGTVEVESAPDQGTSVRLRLPA